MRKKCPATIEKRLKNLFGLADSKNDLSSPAIGKIRKQNPRSVRNKYGTLCSLWSP